jgi:hypothetical protein
MRHALRIALLLALVTLLPVTACSRREEAPQPTAPPPAGAAAPPVDAPAPLRVQELTLGKDIASDKTISTATYEFAPTDTIYLSVKTIGRSSGSTLTANWTYQDGQQVSQTSQQIAPNGPAVTEFHIAKPDGWPQGLYRVQVFLDGVESGSKELVVR